MRVKAETAQWQCKYPFLFVSQNHSNVSLVMFAPPAADMCAFRVCEGIRLLVKYKLVFVVLFESEFRA